MSGKRVSLPLHGKMLDLVAPPTIEAMRARLGGRITPPAANAGAAPAHVGDVVRAGDADPPRAGVVVAADHASVDVLSAGTVRRSRGAAVRPWLGTIGPDVAQLAARARAFGQLVEGEAVQFTRSDAAEPIPELGILVEKCRWGALVQRGDGVVLGVGFQRLAAVRTGDRPN
jgi:hypothetical protein